MKRRAARGGPGAGRRDAMGYSAGAGVPFGAQAGQGRVAAQTFRLVWLVLAIRLALPVDISLPAAPV